MLCFACFSAFQFDWTAYVTEVYKWASVSVEPSLRVIVTSPHYFKSLTGLFNNTDPLLVNYHCMR